MTDHAALRRAAHQFLHTTDGIEGKVLPDWIEVREDAYGQRIKIRDERVTTEFLDGYEFLTFSRRTPTPGAQ